MVTKIRKIETPEEMERKRKRNTLIMSSIMIGILLLSTAGYFSMNFGSNGSSVTNKVQDVGDAWVFNYGDQSIRLGSSPESGQNVSILMSTGLESYAGKTVYVASDNQAYFSEIYNSLGRYSDRMQPACYGPCSSDLPEKDCNDTMIVVKNLNESQFGTGRIYESGNCLFIEGGLTAVDAFLYKIFGIN
jgi:hypothetical protein